MSRRIAPHRQAETDQLLAILRDAGSATTGELRRRMPPGSYGLPCSCRCRAISHEVRRQRRSYDAQDVRTLLRRAARNGAPIVEIKPPGGNQQILWAWQEAE